MVRKRFQQGRTDIYRRPIFTMVEAVPNLPVPKIYSPYSLPWYPVFATTRGLVGFTGRLATSGRDAGPVFLYGSGLVNFH